MQERRPVRRSVIRNFEDGRGISLIYFDPCFDRLCESEALQQRQRQRATSGGIDNKLRLDRLNTAFGIFAPDGSYSGAIRQGDKLHTAAARAHIDVGDLLNRTPDRELKDWSGHAKDIEAKVALRKGIVAWTFVHNVEPELAS